MDNLKDASRIFAGLRVVLTGYSGFKGSWLALWLRLLGAEVLGFGLPAPHGPSMNAALDLDSLIPHAHIDIANYALLAQSMKDFQPDIVFHLAAQALVRPSYQDPLHTLHTNIMGTAHVLEACRHTASVKAAVIVTSDKCYRNNEWVWGYRDNDPRGGHAPYSASKGCAELITTSYIKSFFPQGEYGKTHHVAVASARAGNAIGGGDWGKDRLIPDCFRALHAARPVHIRFPAAVRPWQHVLDCLSGYLLLGARLLEHGPRFGCGWNFAPVDPGDIWSVERVVRHICKLWGNGEYTIDASPQPHEAHALCLDCAKASRELGWHPRYRVAEALERTTTWYRQWMDNPDPLHMRETTLRQIQEYTEIP